MVVSTYRKEKNLRKQFYGQAADGSNEASRIDITLLYNVHLDLKVHDNSLNGVLGSSSVLTMGPNMLED